MDLSVSYEPSSNPEHEPRDWEDQHASQSHQNVAPQEPPASSRERNSVLATFNVSQNPPEHGYTDPGPAYDREE